MLLLLSVCSQVFTGRGFVSRLLLAPSDLNHIQTLDDDLTRCLADMQTALHATTMQLHRMTYDHLSRANALILERIEQLGGPEVSGNDRGASEPLHPWCACERRIVMHSSLSE